MHQTSLVVYVASLNRIEDKTLELRDRDNGTDFECIVKKQKLIFSEFIPEYFLEEAPIMLYVGGRRVNLISYKVKKLLCRKI
jgi:hypothetical protein